VAPPYPQKLALTSPTSVERSVGIVCSRTQATEFFSSFEARVTTGICSHVVGFNFYYLVYGLVICASGLKTIGNGWRTKLIALPLDWSNDFP
jgi:hypothetical protein